MARPAELARLLDAGTVQLAIDVRFPLADARKAHERAASGYTHDKSGVRVGAIRLATTVHGIGDPALVTILARIALEKDVSAYIGDGANRSPAVHVSDAGRLYRLVQERVVQALRRSRAPLHAAQALHQSASWQSIHSLDRRAKSISACAAGGAH